MMDSVSQTATQDDEMESELYDFVYPLKVSGTICICGGVL